MHIQLVFRNGLAVSGGTQVVGRCDYMHRGIKFHGLGFLSLAHSRNSSGLVGNMLRLIVPRLLLVQSRTLDALHLLINGGGRNLAFLVFVSVASLDSGLSHKRPTTHIMPLLDR